jgi:hypothetical protein
LAYGGNCKCKRFQIVATYRPSLDKAPVALGDQLLEPRILLLALFPAPQVVGLGLSRTVPGR